MWHGSVRCRRVGVLWPLSLPGQWRAGPDRRFFGQLLALVRGESAACSGDKTDTWLPQDEGKTRATWTTSMNHVFGAGELTTAGQDGAEVNLINRLQRCKRVHAAHVLLLSLTIRYLAASPKRELRSAL